MLVKKSLQSLTGKLLFTIGTLMIIGSTLFWFFLFRHQERELLQNSVKYGYSFVDYMKKSTRYGMLTFQELLIQQTVEAIGSAEGVLNVRILDSQGKVKYSTNKEDVGVILDSRTPICRTCHVEGGPTKETPSWSIQKGDRDFRILNIIQPIQNEAACYTSTCHAHPKDQRVLGIIEANLSLEILDKSIKQQGIAITIYVLAFLFVISVVLCLILWNLVSTPVSMLAKGMERVAGGDLDYTININRKDEIGELANAFNAMTSDLKKAKNELMDWGNTLEKKVLEKTEAIHRAQAQLIHSEKLASLGRMAAGVAHEINSPLTGIVTFGHLLLKKFPPGTQEREDIEVIIDQANRCSTIIKGLLGFARASAAEKALTNINDVLHSSMNIVRNKADFFDIKLITNFDPALLRVKADSSQLQQVFLNMIMNAADAMEGKGTLTLTTRNISENGRDFVEVEFRDTGPGIPEDNLEKLFEPFFTTKPVGKGTGLGLAVSHGIIQEHGGKIAVRTKLNEGSSFMIKLPAQRENT
ncbi:MAG: sensor histidine kinase, 2 heme-binding site [Nitrospirae bacterium]|nr:sensor histidine kinase, 2 heme-binding site [Nitrospirota bacterium]MBS1126061.1 sensor histidine kinase, 2 heme-binding site [Nitrospirota bacterium]